MYNGNSILEDKEAYNKIINLYIDSISTQINDTNIIELLKSK